VQASGAAPDFKNGAAGNHGGIFPFSGYLDGLSPLGPAGLRGCGNGAAAANSHEAFRCVARTSKNSAWLITAFTSFLENGLVRRNAGSGRSPVSSSSG
jgi:hypothetical protein